MDDVFRPSLPPASFYEVAEHPHARKDLALTQAEELSLQLVVLKLRIMAGSVKPAIEGTTIRILELDKFIVFKDGYLSPLCVMYEMSADGKCALILEVLPTDSAVIEGSDGTYLDAYAAEIIAEIIRLRRQQSS